MTAFKLNKSDNLGENREKILWICQLENKRKKISIEIADADE